MAVDPSEECKCAICQDIMTDPVITPCRHEFCRECLLQGLTVNAKCPICRVSLTAKQVSGNRKRQKVIDATLFPCRNAGCAVRLPLAKLLQHEASCPAGKTPHKAATNLPRAPPASLINRSTFSCPFCSAATHLTCKQLVEHVTSSHAATRRHSGVCPICAAMPWGDPNYKSQDLPSHMQTRHKFEYDTYTDFEKTDDDLLQEVLQKSLEDQ
eukprot:TRINITY_DN2622_c0_g1_i1.p1 TRINITY_DN2622_c0_g1~~TRINITY_DN2622_c0_g1_i1.p1  ORF type:complete len:219 (+),score=50.07 TRINITY_DN2622_c0_g1_i1:23-658(+)